MTFIEGSIFNFFIKRLQILIAKVDYFHDLFREAVSGGHVATRNVKKQAIY